MWFYYFICLSLILSFHDGFVSAEEECKDIDEQYCWIVKDSGGCDGGMWDQVHQEQCPITCNVGCGGK